MHAATYTYQIPGEPVKIVKQLTTTRTPDFLSQERRFSGVFAICGTPMGTESKYVTMFYTNAFHVGGKGVRSLLDGLRISPVKVSYTDLHKIPG